MMWFSVWWHVALLLAAAGVGGILVGMGAAALVYRNRPITRNP